MAVLPWSCVAATHSSRAEYEGCCKGLEDVFEVKIEMESGFDLLADSEFSLRDKVAISCTQFKFAANKNMERMGV